MVTITRNTVAFLNQRIGQEFFQEHMSNEDFRTSLRVAGMMDKQTRKG